MSERPLHEVPMRTLERPAPRIELTRASDGIVYLSSGIPYQPGLPSLVDYFARAVELRPESTFLAERDVSGAWRRITYAQAWRDTTAIATWLIGSGFGPGGPPVMI